MQALSLYIKRIGKDYLTVFKDVLLESRQKPIKASFYISLISAAYYAKITRPDESLYISKLVELRQEMVLLPNSIHSSTADKKLEEITKFCINNRIDIYDCIFFSLVVARAYDKKIKFVHRKRLIIEELAMGYVMGKLDRCWRLKSFLEFGKTLC